MVLVLNLHNIIVEQWIINTLVADNVSRWIFCQNLRATVFGVGQAGHVEQR